MLNHAWISQNLHGHFKYIETQAFVLLQIQPLCCAEVGKREKSLTDLYATVSLPADVMCIVYGSYLQEFIQMPRNVEREFGELVI